ncbi:hypothetical protein B4134_2524 [Bacillus safensis]|nr:hypothetical protein B4134_2524 [Bacillus safensis]
MSKNKINNEDRMLGQFILPQYMIKRKWFEIKGVYVVVITNGK